MNDKQKGFKLLRRAAEKACEQADGIFNEDGCGHCSRMCAFYFCDSFKWAISRAKQYGEKLNVDWRDVLTAWEEGRDRPIITYYTEKDMPSIETGRVRIFETTEQLWKEAGKTFRCSTCGEEIEDSIKCDYCGWTVRGPFGTLGKGTYVISKDRLKVHQIFMPTAWEEKNK